VTPWSKAVSISMPVLETGQETAITEAQARFVGELQSGDERAFEQLVAQYERPIVRFLYRYLGNSEEAKEVCQDVFVKIFRGINSFHNNCSLKTWIYRITLNTVLNEKRRWYQRLKDRLVPLEAISRTRYDSIPDPALSLTMSDRCRSVSLALRKMRPDQRAILVMRDLEGLSYQQISDALGLALGTVKSRLARARQEMKDAIQDLI